MPQIKVNEIDASVVTRVESGSKATIFCPIIASFGPGYDGTQGSVGKFTDITDFDRAYGYTDAQFNPFKNEYSRMYARELIKKGAEVAVVRLNNSGNTASFDVDGASSTRTNPGTEPSLTTVAPAVWYNPELLAKTKDGTGTTDATAYTIPGSITGSATVEDEPVKFYDDGKGNVVDVKTKAAIGTVDYTSGDITPTSGTVTATAYKYLVDGSSITDWYRYTFCPQIVGIEAKYPGSFGNNLIISISQVNTSRLTESYQYAVISVYYVDSQVNYGWDAETGTSYVQSRIVKSTVLLENKRVSTNPNSPDYFEDVEFDFIKIIPTVNARDELALVWNDIDAGADSSRRYAGFPTIPFRYKDAQGYTTQYNFAASFNKTFGTDFAFSDDIVEKLRYGYVDFWKVGVADGAWTVPDIDKYMKEVYGYASDNIIGIIPGTFATLADTYSNFTDPYMYDFDFITSSGFVYEEYALAKPKTDGTPQSNVNLTLNTALSGNLPIKPTSVTITGTLNSEAVTYKDNGAGGLYLSTDTQKAVVATIDYATGKVTGTTAAEFGSSLKISYTPLVDDTSKPLIASLVYPLSSGPDGDFAVYTSVTPIHVAMRNLVETRQDCVALFDVPRDYDRQLIVEYSRMLNTSYGTIHHPWGYVKSPDVFGKLILMSPSYIFLYTYLSNLINNIEAQKWFPPAGVDRATARVVVKPDYEIGSVLLDEWQNANTSRVNPIMRLKQYGYVIYGQYTTLEAIDQYTHSALESLNVRLISNVVKREIFDACLVLAFDPNNEDLWLKFRDRMDRFLRYMKNNGGLYGYRIIMDKSTVTTDDINHLRCPGKVMIAPTRTAEFFDIDFTITDAGVQFDE